MVAEGGRDRSDNTEAEKENGSDAGTDKPASDKKPDKLSGKLSSLSVTVLNNEIEIQPSNPLPYLDQGPVKAYVARGKGGKDGNYFALVCEKHLVPRVRMGVVFANVLNPSLVRLVASGVAYWPPAGAERYMFVYSRDIGMPLMKSLKEDGLGWKQDQVMSAVIKPMIDVLLDLRNKDITHGNIRPTNMFDGGTQKVERIILGECLATPPSYAQPVVMETVHRALADPLGRGIGTLQDDLYSFGVSLAMILRSRDPLKGLSDEDIIRSKIEKGSYLAIVGKERFPAALLELLRGLLYDNHSQRWTLDDVLTWQDGQRLSPKQSSRMSKASRPLVFEGEHYFWPSLLAHDMNKNPSAAVELINSQALEQWVDRSLESSMTKNRLEDAIESAGASGQDAGYTDRLISRVSIALDPEAPIRFKGLNVHPYGIPPAMMGAYCQSRDVQPYIEVINQKMVAYWLAAQPDFYSESVTLAKKYDNCRMFLNQNSIAYGMERCLYFLNSDAPCLSEKLAHYYIRNVEDLMNAFEDMSGKPDRPYLFIDRHIAAFLSVKERKVIDPFLIELNSSNENLRILGNILCLASIQKRERLGAFPGIGGWVLDLMPALLERYHDRHLRDYIQKKIEKLAKAGDIVKIAGILDNEEAKTGDFSSFRQAMREYDDLRKETAKINHKLKRPESFGKKTGQELAAVFSAFLAGIVILTFAFIAFFKDGTF
ncbi:MAG: hypothetical protein H6868_09935 [Rhodospirillales bacterium]|nr:hypothetical protein [Rhodospirillales bacterium]